jgi:hypothetical protein
VAAQKQIEFLARALVNRLEDRGIVEFGDAEEGIQLVAIALERDFATIDAIEQEARQRLAEKSSREPKADDLEAEMQRIAAERGVTL